MNSPNQQGTLKDIIEKIKDIRTAMLTSTNSEGVMHSRPMSAIDITEDNNIWFFTKEPTEKTTEINNDSDVNLSFSDSYNQTYVSIAGKASISHDKQKMQQLWRPMLKAWFPRGLDEPGIALLQVRIYEAAYWDSSTSQMIRFFQLDKSNLEGSRYTEDKNSQLRGI